MHAFTIFAAALLTAGPDPTPTVVKEASLFKNGYSFVTREFKLNPSGETIITDIPNASYGTFWISASPGVTIESAVNTTGEYDIETRPDSMISFLYLNIGKDVVLQVRNGSKPDLVEFSGKLENINGQICLLRLEGGEQVLSIATVDIIRASVRKDAVTKTSGKGTRRFIKIRSKGSGTGTLYGVEAGLSWSPSYLIDISDPKKFKLVSRCTVVNELADLNGSMLRFVSGSPSISYLGTMDPFTQMMQAGMGGFGGGGGRPGSPAPAMQNVASDSAMAEVVDAPFESNGSGEAIGDLYFYAVPKISLKRSDRGYFVLFSESLDYNWLYTVDAGPGENQGVVQVWRGLKFVNSADKPFTSAPAMVVSNGQMVGQDSMSYTARGQEGLVRVSQALDVRTEIVEDETDRVRNALQRPNSRSYDKVTVKGTIAVTNLKSEAVTMRIRKSVVGDALPLSDAKVVRSTSSIRDLNPVSNLEWMVTVKPKDTIKLNYGYTVYVE